VGDACSDRAQITPDVIAPLLQRDFVVVIAKSLIFVKQKTLCWPTLTTWLQ
jgi:hypothetical protein